MPPSTTPGAITTYSTIYSIGIEWDIGATDDTNHDCTVTVRYRIGAGAWSTAQNLIRIDYTPPDPRGGLTAARNMLAGSVFFLQPNTTYEVELTLNDPDVGSAVETRSVTTRRLPAKPTGGNTLHVAPGAGGGSGTHADPYLGLAAAQTAAVAGDIIKIHPGSYGSFTFSKAGTAGGTYLVWENEGDGASTFTSFVVGASYIWLQGLTVGPNAGSAITVNGAHTDVVISRNISTECHYTIHMGGGDVSYWYIADNTFVGDTDPLGGSFSGEGIDMQHTIGHTIAHNEISRAADGISYPLYNVDIFGNDIHDCSDDAIEFDYGYSNVRAWRNRCYRAGQNNGLSWQPQNMGPHYIIRNQDVITTTEGPFKLKPGETDRGSAVLDIVVNFGGSNRFQNNAAEMLDF